jgi:hypothetical protein
LKTGAKAERKRKSKVFLEKGSSGVVNVLKIFLKNFERGSPFWAARSRKNMFYVYILQSLG